MGDFFGGGSKSSVQPAGQQTTVSRSEPWDVQKGYLTDVYGRAAQLANTPRSYYPNSTVVPFSGQTQDALGAMENRARTGSPIQQTGADEYLKTLQGGYLNANPHLDAMYDRSARAVTRNFNEAVAPGIQGSWAKAGRYGSNLYLNAQNQAQDTLGRILGEMGTDIYGRAYESERGRMNDLVVGAPQYAQSDYLDAQMLGQVGQAREGQAGLELQDQVNRWNFQQEEPRTRLQDYLNMVQGNAGQTVTQTQPIYRQQTASPFSQAVQGIGSLGLLGAMFL